MDVFKNTPELPKLSPSAQAMYDEIVRLYPNTPFTMSELKAKLQNPPGFTAIFNELIGKVVQMGEPKVVAGKNVITFKRIYG